MSCVSVIVTAYNVERYIGGTVQSALAQTLADIEVIVVDDGSTDGTWGILEAMTAEDQRLKPIQQANGGVSAARNTGLENASGTHVLFLDGDDHLLASACEALYGVARATGADIVVSDYLVRGEGDERESRISGGSFVALDGRDFAKLLLGPEFPVAIWNKMFRRGLFTDHSISFPVAISMGEDFATLFELSCHAGRVVKLDQPAVVYVKRAGSLVRTSSPHLLSVTAALERILELQKRFLEPSAELESAFQVCCYFHVMSARVIPGRSFGGIHRQLYDWYMRQPFPAPHGVCEPVRSRLSAAERLVARGYGCNYRAGTSLRRAVDLLRRAKPGRKPGR